METKDKVTQAQEALSVALKRADACQTLKATKVSKWSDSVSVTVVIDGIEIMFSAPTLLVALNTQLVEHNKAVVEARRNLSIAVREWSEELAE